MPDTAGRRPPRKTKLEKIAELEASLKLAKEEIHMQRKEIHKLKNGGKEARNDGGEISLGDAEKLKTALKAMKRVTVKQEMNLQSMRQSANDRRRLIKERDETIATLKQQLRRMEKTMKSMEEPDQDLQQRRVRSLEKRCFAEENNSLELRQKLERAEARIRQLEKKNDAQHRDPFNFHNSSSSQSVSSTMSDADVAKLKQELAKKSTRICNLEYELEAAKDELVGLKNQARNGSGSFTGHESFQASFTIGEDGFPAAHAIGSDPFSKSDPFGGSALGNSIGNLFSDSESEEEEESDLDDQS